MFRKSTTLLSVLVVLTLSSTSCSFESKKNIASGETGASQSAEDTRFFNFSAGSEPEYLDPALIVDTVSGAIAFALFEGLLHPDAQGGKPHPGIAKSWTLSPDKRTYTFSLRQNAKWSNGEPITAHDFVYSWTRVIDPVTASSYAFIMFPIKNAQAFNSGSVKDASKLGFRAVDDFTFEVTLENPTPYFVELASFSTLYPVHKATVEKFGPRWVRPENIVSSGPFKMTEWKPYKNITVVKNDQYWDAKNVDLPGIHFFSIEDRETALKMYDSGRLDVLWGPPQAKLPALMSRSDYRMTPVLSTYFYEINVTRPLMKDPRVRQALAMSIDRKLLCEKYLQKTKLPSTNYVPPYMKGYNSPKGLDFNPKEAKALLAEVGYEDPSTFPPISISYNTLDAHKLIAQVIQQMWKEHLGINVTLHNEEWKSFLKTKRSKNYDIARSGWYGDYTDPNTFMELYTSDSTQNDTGWKNTNYDRLISAAWKETDEKTRSKLFQEAEKILLNEAPIIPLYTATMAYLVQPYVKGFYPTPKDIHPLKWISINQDLLAQKLAKD